MTKVDLGIKDQVTERLQALQRVGGNVATQTPTQPPADAPSASKGPKPAFYELDRYVKFREPLALVGVALVLYGVSQFSMRVMYILAGLIVFAISWMMAR